MNGFLDNYGFSNYPPNEEQIVKVLDRGHPLFMAVLNSNGQGHVRLITGYTLESTGSCDYYMFTIMDPDIGTFTSNITDIHNNLITDTMITAVSDVYCP